MITFIQSPNYSPGRQGKQITDFVYHWIDGYQHVADIRFSDPKSQVSAHFSVEDTSVHQYVKASDTAWHAGKFSENLQSIGIEHSAQPGRDATDATYETSSQLVADVAKALGRKVAEFNHFPHRFIIPTACPGSLDIARIVARAKEIEAAALATLTSVVLPVHGFPRIVHVTAQDMSGKHYSLNIRPNHSISFHILGAFPYGWSVEVKDMARGDAITIGNSSSDLWLETMDGGWIAAAGTDFLSTQSI